MKTTRHCKKHDKTYKLFSSLTKCPDCEHEIVLASRDRAAEKRKQGKKDGLKQKEDANRRRAYKKTADGVQLFPRIGSKRGLEGKVGKDRIAKRSSKKTQTDRIL
jgi:hypothetical protein